MRGVKGHIGGKFIKTRSGGVKPVCIFLREQAEEAGCKVFHCIFAALLLLPSGDFNGKRLSKHFHHFLASGFQCPHHRTKPGKNLVGTFQTLRVNMQYDNNGRKVSLAMCFLSDMLTMRALQGVM